MGMSSMMQCSLLDFRENIFKVYSIFLLGTKVMWRILSPLHALTWYCFIWKLIKNKTEDYSNLMS